ncbi:MAG: polysaccharide deacetylase [Anaerocolumna sp.]|jgi:peptidoglycan/xylan/chitin deacetylase (PgdA/CDA1 family)|nr:polysaccharide deacetylase [Anaerocolumna sp.]
MRFPEGKDKALTLSYDDGVEQDIKLLSIMNQYGLKGTFNINSGLYAEEGTIYSESQIHRRMTKRQISDAFMNSGQEVAVHSLTHPFLEQLPTAMVIKEIIEDRENLEKQFGTIVRGMAYPYGTWNDSVVDALKSCGIVYARTVVSTFDFRLPVDWMRLTATCHHNAPNLLELASEFVEDKVSRAPYLFYLWGHSYEFEDNNNWRVIEEFAKYTGHREDIWYATNIEIYEYIEAFNRLVFSVNGKSVKNPNRTKVWFKLNGETIAIKAGETITM